MEVSHPRRQRKSRSPTRASEHEKVGPMGFLARTPYTRSTWNTNVVDIGDWRPLSQWPAANPPRSASEIHGEPQKLGRVAERTLSLAAPEAAYPAVPDPAHVPR